MARPILATKEELKLLIEAELESASFIPLRHALESYLVEPYVRTLIWPYSQTIVEFPCWIFADLGPHQQGMTLGYSVFGHGSYGDPWGIILANNVSFGRDDSWFEFLEDAFINSGAWTQQLPPEYEVR
jgi:hypothetical protein